MVLFISKLQPWLLLICALAQRTSAFLQQPSSPEAQRIRPSPEEESSSSALRGIAEWRSHNQSNNNPSKDHNPTIFLLPFSVDQISLPGQSETLVFKQGRFIDLLEQATTEHHNSVIGAAVMGDDKLDGVLSLCEISSYELDAGFRGKVTATVSLRCVGRAQLDELLQVQPVMLGQCHELVDTVVRGGATDNEDENDLWGTCEQIVKDIETLLESNVEEHARYQKAYWQALTALGYTPITLLTRDPSATNTQKELQAASWATLSLLVSARARHQGLQTNDLRERLQTGRNGLLQQQIMVSSSSTSAAFDESGFE